MSAIADLDPRKDMSLIRERLSLQLTRGEDVAPLLADLAIRNPIALADLVVGPRAQHDTGLVRGALTVIEPLEQALAPNGLYRRLVALSKETQMEVLQTAARRHPTGSWLIELSRKVEGQDAGMTHLSAVAGHPSFTAACWSHAKAGHLPGLIAVAHATGLPEPAAALAVHGHLDACAIALVRTLERTPESPVVSMIAAAWGPDPSPILMKAIGHLRSRKVALALQTQTRGYAQYTSLLKSVIQAMVHE